MVETKNIPTLESLKSKSNSFQEHCPRPCGLLCEMPTSSTKEVGVFWLISGKEMVEEHAEAIALSILASPFILILLF